MVCFSEMSAFLNGRLFRLISVCVLDLMVILAIFHDFITEMAFDLNQMIFFEWPAQMIISSK